MREEEIKKIIRDVGLKYNVLGENKEISEEQYNGINLESLKLEITK